MQSDEEKPEVIGEALRSKQIWKNSHSIRQTKSSFASFLLEFRFFFDLPRIRHPCANVLSDVLVLNSYFNLNGLLEVQGDLRNWKCCDKEVKFCDLWEPLDFREECERLGRIDKRGTLLGHQEPQKSWRMTP